MSGTVAVVGGGLAGITAALGCADAGYDVTVLEARSRLGGLTHSFRRDVQGGGSDRIWVDNGQHVFLRCCTSYLALLERLGVSDLVVVQPRLDVTVRSGRHRGVGRLRRTALSAPLHLGASLARYRWLSPMERLRVITAALALGRVDRTDPAVDAQSFGDWLAAHGQDDRAVEAVWDLIGVATLNSAARDASLALAATVFQVGLLGRSDAADIGWARVPLQRLHGDAAVTALAVAGAEVRTRTKVRLLEADLGAGKDGWLVHTTEGSSRHDQVVLATSPEVAEALLPAGSLDLAAGWSDRLGATPIVNVHILLDRKVLDEPFVAVVDSPLQWVFDRTEQSGLNPADGQYLALSLSAADDLIDLPVVQLRRQLLPELRRVLPESAHAQVKEFFVTREPRATFRPAPGVGRWRPPPATRWPGLHLAGAWTDTTWPATMEGAVRSGEAAVAAMTDRRTAGYADIPVAGGRTQQRPEPVR